MISSNYTKENVYKVHFDVLEMDKRGELTSTQIVSIILVIIGLAIGLMFFFGIFKNESLTDRELCKLSILSRATLPSVASQAVPLSCFTEKICITLDKPFVEDVKDALSLSGSAIGFSKKSECEQFAGEENVRTVKLKIDGSIKDEKSREIVQREVANAMFDCWHMAGQGKLDIFDDLSSKSVGGKIAQSVLGYAELTVSEIKPKCIVCSRVAFSKSLIEADKKFGFSKNIDYNSFMSREKIDGSSGLTYIQAFTDPGVGSGYSSIGGSEGLSKYFGYKAFTNEQLEEIKGILELQFKNQPEELKKIEELIKTETNLIKYFEKLSNPDNSDQLAIVFTQIKVSAEDPKDQYWSTFQNGAVIGGITAISGPGKIASLFIPGPGWLKAVFKISAVGVTSFNLASSAEKNTRKNQALSAATCGTFESRIEGKQNGCSLVKLVNWDSNTLKNLCMGGSEGNL